MRFGYSLLVSDTDEIRVQKHFRNEPRVSETRALDYMLILFISPVNEILRRDTCWVVHGRFWRCGLAAFNLVSL